MVWIWNGIWNPEAQPFEIWTNGCHFVKNHLKSRQKCPDFEWSGFWMVGTIAAAIAKTWPFEICSLQSLNFKCLGISNGRISDPHCIKNFLIFCSLESEAVSVQEKLSKLETKYGDLEADLEEEIIKNQVQSRSVNGLVQYLNGLNCLIVEWFLSQNMVWVMYFKFVIWIETTVGIWLPVLRLPETFSYWNSSQVIKWWPE